MRRRDFLQLLVSGAVGSHIDVDRLLWEPNKVTYFLPTVRLASASEIIALEMARIVPKIKTLFERDDIFYKQFIEGGSVRVSSREIHVPLQFGVDWGKDESKTVYSGTSRRSNRNDC